MNYLNLKFYSLCQISIHILIFTLSFNVLLLQKQKKEGKAEIERDRMEEKIKGKERKERKGRY